MAYPQKYWNFDYICLVIEYSNGHHMYHPLLVDATWGKIAFQSISYDVNKLITCSKFCTYNLLHDLCYQEFFFLLVLPNWLVWLFELKLLLFWFHTFLSLYFMNFLLRLLRSWIQFGELIGDISLVEITWKIFCNSTTESTEKTYSVCINHFKRFINSCSLLPSLRYIPNHL